MNATSSTDTSRKLIIKKCWCIPYQIIMHYCNLFNPIIKDAILYKKSIKVQLQSALTWLINIENSRKKDKKLKV